MKDSKPLTAADIKSFISMFDKGAGPGDFLIRGDMLIQLNHELADTVEPRAWYVMNDNGKLLKVDIE